MRTTFLLACLAITGQAVATFDLMYLPSSQTNRVLRYDPVNRLALGGFAAPGASSVYNRGARYGQVNINAGGYAYDFYSGTNSGYVITGAQGVLNNGNVFRFVASTFASYNLPSGSTASNIGLSVGGLFAGNVLPSGHIVALSVSGTDLISNTFSSTGVFQSSQIFLQNATLAFASGAIVSPTRYGTTVLAVAIKVDAGPIRLAKLEYNPGGALSSFTVPQLNNFSSSHAVGVATNHAGYYVVGADSATPTTARFMSVDNDGLGFTYDNWTESSLDLRNPLNNGYSVGMVLAPEPGEWLAMSMGIGALLVRRKRRTRV